LKRRNKIKILILEDNPIRIEKFKELFRNQDIYLYSDTLCAKEACKIIEFDALWLDHDLNNRIWEDSQEENSGYQFVKWLVDNGLQKNSLNYIHSMNPIGANKMLNLLLDNGRDGIWIPFYLIKF